MACIADTATELVAPSIEEAALQQAASIFHTLSHPCRLRLLVALAGGQVCDVNTLVSLCGRPQPYVSQQLAALRSQGIV